MASNGGNLDTKVEAVKENSPASVFVNSEPIREEQVQSAMKFLSHPKVRGSPVMNIRSFLEGKGLTKEEIDEAFQRVLDTLTAAVSRTHPAISSQDGQIKPSLSVQQQPPTQVPVGSTSKIEMLSQFPWVSCYTCSGITSCSRCWNSSIFQEIFCPKVELLDSKGCCIRRR